LKREEKFYIIWTVIGQKVMSMPLEDMEKTRKEMATTNDDKPRDEPRVYESGYFLLSQQITSLRDSMDSKFETARKETEFKFSEVRKEIKELSVKTDARFAKVDDKLDEIRKEIKELADRTDARFNELIHRHDEKFGKIDTKLDEVRKEINGLQRWMIASINILFKFRYLPIPARTSATIVISMVYFV
jgi:uncharacterized protein YdcH (DUF465 family)